MPDVSRDLPLQAAILQATRVLLASTGYASTTVKSVAAAAGVAPGVVTSLYSNRDRLFAAALKLPFDPSQAVPEMIAPGLDGLGERLVRMTLSLMDDEDVRADFGRIVGADSTTTYLGAEAPGPVVLLRTLSDYLQSAVVDRVVTALGIPDARLRITLITSQLVGLATMRYILRIEPLASASDDAIVALVGPGIQALLDPTSTRT